MSPQDLAQVLRQLPPIRDSRVLVGPETSDDAAVYRINDHQALVQTVDFFTPVVDDPYVFGQIAAANSLSDIYAMGAEPLFALNIIGFPSGTLPLSIMGEILKGGAHKAAEAGIEIIGGHTIDDQEPKYGLIVNGLIDPARVVTNSGARPGDDLILTKPLGIGIIVTALKKGKPDPAAVDAAVEAMSTLNGPAARAMQKVGVHACTDVTGFGLLGHLHEMTEGAGVGARIYRSQIPVIPGTRELAQEGFVPGGTYANLRFLEGAIDWNPEISEVERLILADAQTSGGLLISVPKQKTQQLLEELETAGVSVRALIGEITADSRGRIRVEP